MRTLAVTLLAFCASGVAPTRPSRGGIDFLSLRFETGSAKTLPLPADGSNPFASDPGGLLAATFASLDGSRDSLVHLETVRRALRFAIQSDGENEFGLARTLEARLAERALVAACGERPDPLAWLDAAVATLATGEQYGTFAPEHAALLDRAAELAPADGGIRLAAGIARIAVAGKTRWQDHYSAAFAASERDPRLARTIDSLPAHLRPSRESLGEPSSRPASRSARR